MPIDPADEDPIVLWHGIQFNEDIGSFACLSPAVYPDGRIEVALGVRSDGEHRYRLRPGDTFPVRDQTWKLDHVENPSADNWKVWLVRVT